MSSSNTSNVFNEVRSYCVDFIQKGDLSSLHRLDKKLQEIDKDALDDIALYILFPFRVLLKKQHSRNDDLLVQSLKCMSFIFSHVTILDWAVVHEFLTHLCNVITNPKDLEARGSEELKSVVASAIGNLLGHASFSVRQKLYHYSSIPVLGHVVTLLLSIASENIDKSARIFALKALKSLCKPSYCSLLEESGQNAIKAEIGDCVACFLPGVSTALAKVIVNDTSAGHKVKITCMEVIASFIVTPLGDRAPKSKEGLDDDTVNPRLRALIVKRDEKWVSMVTEKLGPIIESVCTASNSDDWSVRFACVKFCGKVLLECKKNLQNHASTLLKVPVKLLNDNYEQIQQFCSKILDDFSNSLKEEESGSHVLVEILEENLFILCSSLPRLMRTSQDAEKLSTLKILLGYLSLLKEHVNGLLYSPPHFKKLTIALLHSFEIDFSSIQMMDVGTSALNDSDVDFESTKSCFRKEFKHFRDGKIYEILCRICNVLGQYGDFEVLLDNFLEIYSISENNCKQAVLILNEIILGAKCSTNNTTEKMNFGVKTLLDEFLSPENWYLVTSFESEYFKTHHAARMQKMYDSDQNLSVVPVTSSASYKEQSLKLLKSNALLCCLHLESILIFSKVLGRDFRSCLMHALYPVLEKTSDPDLSIAGCATRAMRGVALNCGYNSSSALIAENADYLISDISIQIHNLQVFPRCPAVLQAMLNHSNSDILPLVSDTVDEILIALDSHHLEPDKLLVFVPVLFSVVNAVKRWIPTKSFTDNSRDLDTKDSPKRKTNDLSKGEGASIPQIACSVPGTKQESASLQRTNFVENLKSRLLELHKNKKIASLESDPEIDANWKPGQEEDEQYQNPVEEEEKKKPPMEIQVTTKVLTRCVHLMAHLDPRVRMRIMDIVESGMVVLSSLENELLPMAHKLWSPLVARFSDKELQVVTKAFDTICVMTEHSKDFLRKRFCKEILPKILSFLQIQAKYSTRIPKTTTNSRDSAIIFPKILPESREAVAYTHSVAFKLQNRALRGLGPLLGDLDIGRTDLISVCQSCRLYLSSKQPGQLQESAMALFKSLTKIDCDITWLQLTVVWCPNAVIEPPKHLKSQFIGQNLQTCVLGGNTDPKNEFANNIRKLLDVC